MYFLSHSTADKTVVRAVGVELQVLGAEVFFDEWHISAGESIAGAIESALDQSTVFLLFWSTAASSSMWTRREFHAAVRLFIEHADRKLIVIRLDDEPVPTLVADLRYVDLRDGDGGSAVRDILGIKTEPERIRAIQAFLEARGIEVAYFPGYGPAVGCPECGADLQFLEGWSEVDPDRDDTYAGASCKHCGWSDGGEI